MKAEMFLMRGLFVMSAVVTMLGMASFVAGFG